MKIQVNDWSRLQPKTEQNQNMKSVIQFATEAEMAEARRLFPLTKPRTKLAFDDLVLRPEYQSRKFTFAKGQTCIRILPQLAGADGWMHGIHVLAHPNGQHTHPKSLKPKAKSVFDTAYGWLRANKPDLLFNKNNRDGFRLLPSPMAIAFILVEIDGEMQAKLFVGSAYNGEKSGGNSGVGHQLFKVASELRQPSGHDAAHTEHGVQIIVDKSTPHGSKYPNYKMTRGTMEVPISRYIERMSDSEIDALCPLHEVLRRVEPEEEWELLAGVIGVELRDEIRNSTAKPKFTSSPKPEPVPLATDEPAPIEPSTVSDELPIADDTPVDNSDDEWRW